MGGAVAFSMLGVLAGQHYLQDYFVHNLLGKEPPADYTFIFPAQPGAA